MPKQKKVESKINFNYNIPIEESSMLNDDFIIAGTAINAITTSNNHKFLPEVLKESANSLIGVPLLVDHENKVENIKGRVFSAGYDEVGQRIPFKAKVMDKMCREMIKDGRLNSVSVGATVDPKNIEEDKDGCLIPRNIQFRELSLVAVPADQGATFGIALKEAYGNFKDDEDEKDDFEDGEELDEPKEENVQEIIERRENMSEQKTEEKTEKTETAGKVEKVDETKVDAFKQLIEAMTTEMAKLRTEISEMKAKEKAEVKPVVEAKAEAKEEKADVEEDDCGYRIVQGVGSLRGGSFTMIRNKYK
jgi:phage head maturation protease